MMIDMECDIPTKQAKEADLAAFEQTEDEGMGNYINIIDIIGRKLLEFFQINICEGQAHHNGEIESVGEIKGSEVDTDRYWASCMS